MPRRCCLAIEADCHIESWRSRTATGGRFKPRNTGGEHLTTVRAWSRSFQAAARGTHTCALRVLGEPHPKGEKCSVILVSPDVLQIGKKMRVSFICPSSSPLLAKNESTAGYLRPWCQLYWETRSHSIWQQRPITPQWARLGGVRPAQ